MGPGGAPVAVPVRDGRLGPTAAAVGRTLALHRLEQGHRGTTHLFVHIADIHLRHF